MRVRIVLGVVAVLLLLVGVAALFARGGSEVRSAPGQRWLDFDEPPWTQGIHPGFTYEYSVNAHCGIYSARIDGTNWRAVPPVDDGNGNPPPERTRVSSVGQLHIVDRDTAVFETGGLRVTFVRDDLPGRSCA